MRDNIRIRVLHFNWTCVVVMGVMTCYTLVMLTAISQSLAQTSAMSISSAGRKKAGALIFLHGLGDTPVGWSSLESALPSIKPRLSELKYVFPPAPQIPISINGGMTMPGWFDLYDWPIGIGVKDDPQGLQKSVSQIEQIVSKLEKEDGIDRSRIVVGGFSQGGAVALLSAYRDNNKPYAACAVLSGWLTLADDKSVSDASKSTPLFWGHGKYDDKVLFEQQQYGLGVLRQGGVSTIGASSYPVGHSSHPDEINDFANFLDQIFFAEV